MSEFEPSEIEFRSVPVQIDTRELGRVIATGFMIRQLGMPDTLWSWQNIRLRTFKDPTYDHIEIWDHEAKQVNAVPIEDDNRPLVDGLFEAEFPYSFDPVPDAHTYRWWLQWQKHVGAAAIDSYLRQPGLWDEE